jgi:hypothetical protein
MSWFHRHPLSRKRRAGLLIVVLSLIGLEMHNDARPLLPQPAPSETAGTSSPTADLTTTGTSSPTADLTTTGTSSPTADLTTATISPTCAPAAPTSTASPTPDLTATGTASPTPDLTTTATASPTPDLTTATPDPACAAPAPTGTPSPTASQTTPTATRSSTASPSQLTPSANATAQDSDATPTRPPEGSPGAAAPEVGTPTEQAPTETPTPIPTPSDGVACTPGDEIILSGEGPPHAALLLSFDQTVVGGGITNGEGRFRIPLAVGERRAGYYPVTVEERDTRQVLGRWTCIVPAITPTRAPADLP